MIKKNKNRGLTIFFAVISIICVMPIILVVMNSIKLNTFVKTDTVALPTGEMFAKFSNFIKGNRHFKSWNNDRRPCVK